MEQGEWDRSRAAVAHVRSGIDGFPWSLSAAASVPQQNTAATIEQDRRNRGAAQAGRQNQVQISETKCRWATLLAGWRPLAAWSWREPSTRSVRGSKGLDDNCHEMFVSLRDDTCNQNKVASSLRSIEIVPGASDHVRSLQAHAEGADFWGNLGNRLRCMGASPNSRL